jgi:hypothetical protein
MRFERSFSADSCFWSAKRSDKEEEQKSPHTSSDDDLSTVFEAFGGS